MDRKPGFLQRSERAAKPGFLSPGVVLPVLTLLSLALRLLRLNFQPLWWDEGYSVWFATEPLGRMLSLTAQDIHPPLYYALLHGWTLLLGAGPVALRLLSVAVGTLAIPLVYLVARRMLSRRGALLAAFLLTINPLHVYYSQEVRMYGLVALLSAGILAAAWRVMDDRRWTIDDGRRSMVYGLWSTAAYVLLTTAALYTQYYAVFLPIGLTLYAAWRWRRNTRALLIWLGVQAIVAVLYLPWVLYAAPKLVPYISQKVIQDADRPLGLFAYFGRHLSTFLAGHLEGPFAPWWPLALILLIPIATGLWLLFTQIQTGRRQNVNPNPQSLIPNPQSPVMLATITVVALALGWLIGLRYPFFPARGERLLLLALPPFVLLIAAALDALRARWRIAGYVTSGLIVAVSVASLVAFYTVPRYPDDDYRSLIARTVEQGLPGDTVFAVYPWQVGYWRSYGSASGPTAVLSPDPAWGPEVAAALDSALGRGRVWFPAHLALGGILETQIEAHLAGEAAPFINAWYGPNTRLSAWAVIDDAITAASSMAGAAQFALPDDNRVVLAGATVSAVPVEAANAVTPIILKWQADAAPPVLDVSVRLTDDLGQIWAQHDYEPLGGVGNSQSPIPNPRTWSATDRLGLLIPAGTPPGRYTVEVLVQPKGSDRPLEVTNADGQSLGTSARLLILDVAASDRVLGPERLPIGTHEEIDLGDGLRFLGYSTDVTAAIPGELRKASLFWQATAAPSADTIAFIQLLGRDGKAIPLWEAPPGAAYPTGRWTPGTLIRTQAAFRVPAALADGSYRLIAGLYRPSDGARLRTPQGKDYVAIGSLTVRGRPHDLNPPAPQHPMDVRLGDVARLVGYDLPATEVAPGGTVDVTLDWQATASAPAAYTVFVHLVSEAGAIQGYGDGEPGSGAYPTTGWLPGEYLSDPHVVTIAPAAPPGVYRLAIGLYDPATGERLKTLDGADQVLLETPITVR